MSRHGVAWPALMPVPWGVQLALHSTAGEFRWALALAVQRSPMPEDS
jgi:hypothetical protein